MTSSSPWFDYNRDPHRVPEAQLEIRPAQFGPPAISEAGRVRLAAMERIMALADRVAATAPAVRDPALDAPVYVPPELYPTGGGMHGHTKVGERFVPPKRRLPAVQAGKARGVW